MFPPRLLDLMDEEIPNKMPTENSLIHEELVELLREFLKIKLTKLRLKKLEEEEKLLDIEQYGEDADDAFFDWDWSRKNC